MSDRPNITPGDRAGLDQAATALSDLVGSMGLEVVGWPKLDANPTLASLAVPAARALVDGMLFVVVPVNLPSVLAFTAAVVGRAEGEGGSNLPA